MYESLIEFETFCGRSTKLFTAAVQKIANKKSGGHSGHWFLSRYDKVPTVPES